MRQAESIIETGQLHRSPQSDNSATGTELKKEKEMNMVELTKVELILQNGQASLLSGRLYWAWLARPYEARRQKV